MESRLERFIVFFLQKIKIVLAVLVLIGIILIGVYSYVSYKQQVEMSVAAELYQYEKKYDSFLNKQNESDWLASLNDVKALGEKYSNDNGQRALYMVALTYYKQKDYEKAAALFQEILNRKTSIYSDFSTLFLAGIKGENNKAEAIQILDKFTKERKKSFLYSKAILDLGQNYIWMKDFKSARRILFDNMNQFNPNDQKEAKAMLAYISVNEK